jgi:hypothetical protein
MCGTKGGVEPHKGGVRGDWEGVGRNKGDG